jgi:hypothetical protein
MLDILYGILIVGGFISLLFSVGWGLMALDEKHYAHPNCISRIERLENELFPHWFKYTVQYSYRDRPAELSYYSSDPSGHAPYSYMRNGDSPERTIWEPRPRYREIELPEDFFARG